MKHFHNVYNHMVLVWSCYQAKRLAEAGFQTVRCVQLRARANVVKLPVANAARSSESTRSPTQYLLCKTNVRVSRAFTPQKEDCSIVCRFEDNVQLAVTTVISCSRAADMVPVEMVLVSQEVAE